MRRSYFLSILLLCAQSHLAAADDTSLREHFQLASAEKTKMREACDAFKKNLQKAADCPDAYCDPFKDHAVLIATLDQIEKAPVTPDAIQNAHKLLDKNSSHLKNTSWLKDLAPAYNEFCGIVLFSNVVSQLAEAKNRLKLGEIEIERIKAVLAKFIEIELGYPTDLLTSEVAVNLLNKFNQHGFFKEDEVKNVKLESLTNQLKILKGKLRKKDDAFLKSAQTPQDYAKVLIENLQGTTPLRISIRDAGLTLLTTRR